MSVRHLLPAFAVLLALPVQASPATRAVMAWERTRLAPGVSIAGYDLGPEGSVAASVCSDHGACRIEVLRPGEDATRIYRPDIRASWRQPRFINAQTLIVIEIADEGGVWSSERSSLVRLNLATGKRETLLSGGLISAATPAGRAGICYAQARDGVDLPLVPGRQLKPIRFAVRCTQADTAIDPTLYDSVTDLAFGKGKILFNAAASRFDDQGPRARRGPDGEVAAAGRSLDITTGRSVSLVAPAADQLTWFAGLLGETPLIGRMQQAYWSRRVTDRRTAFFALGAPTPDPLAIVAGNRPGPIRSGGGERGLLLINDPKAGSLAYRFAWLERDGRLTAADRVNQALTSSRVETRRSR